MFEIGNNDKSNHFDEKNKALASDRTTGPTPHSIRNIDRLVEICSLATFLRNFQLSVLSEEEIEIFLRFQSIIVQKEAECFDEAGFN